MPPKVTQDQLEANAAKQAPAAGLLPEERVLIIADGTPRRMKWNFRALAVVEQLEAQHSNAGGLMKLAQFAYALTATHRAKTGDDITFDAFVDELPADPEALSKVTECVVACLPGYMRAEAEPSGNE